MADSLMFGPDQPGLPPSYDEATTRNPVPIIAPYIRREDLFNCSLVCRAWNDSISIELWGEPDACFGFGEKNPLTSFLLFLKTLPQVPTSSRFRVHTLNLERCIADIYITLSSSWFSDLLVLLPELRRLLLPAISFINHSSLLTEPSIKGHLPHSNLYHLNISNLTNTTSKSLVALLTNLTPTLKVLDLSRTNSAGHPDVLRVITSQLQNLKSLKLRWLKLTNEAVGLLARGLQVRVERLDVTGNLLTDDITRDLLDWCFMPPEFEVIVDGGREDARIPAAHDSDDELDAEFGDEEEWMTAKKLQKREYKSLEILVPDMFGNLPPAAGDKGLMHLHVSNNKISAYGVCQLLSSTRLRTLDCGVLQQPLPFGLDADSVQVEPRDISMAIMYYGFRKLRNLRINYRAVVFNATTGTQGAANVLDISKLPRLKILALTDAPSSTADSTFIESLKGFLDKLPETPSNLRTVVLELGDPEATEMGFYGAAAAFTGKETTSFFELSKDDFSFFEDERNVPDQTSLVTVENQEGTRIVGVQNEQVDVLDIITQWRERSRQEGRTWRGVIRILRDLGGTEVSERGIEGNRWGVLVSESGM
ncbi:hypothetical protein H072_5736 [Dactylellina haptotyla CBS 200.50]|uniref:F-box domain-containing protein n=1 Tax=Dactylellina haptotyla (strain CBS 200.50) TaxID=1284197 RepID=S8AH02_DACHA|nr:hypothetical protein H072_5736 [Dactylellina haptotyla CBS 200.50]